MADRESEPRVVVRGSPKRITDHMEAFQRAYVTALAAASGITVAVPVPDPGIDLILSHFGGTDSIPFGPESLETLGFPCAAGEPGGSLVPIVTGRFDSVRTDFGE